LLISLIIDQATIDSGNCIFGQSKIVGFLYYSKRKNPAQRLGFV